MPETKKPLPHQRATLEAIDQLIKINLYPDDENFSNCEESIDTLFGGPEDSGMIIDILTLARIAILHLRGNSFLVHKEKPTTEPIQ